MQSFVACPTQFRVEDFLFHLLRLARGGLLLFFLGSPENQGKQRSENRNIGVPGAMNLCVICCHALAVVPSSFAGPHHVSTCSPAVTSDLHTVPGRAVGLV